MPNQLGDSPVTAPAPLAGTYEPPQRPTETSASPAGSPLTGVAGWMAWFLLGHCFWALKAAASIDEVWEPFTNGAFTSGVSPLLPPLLVLEALGHLSQIVGPAAGLYLTLRRDARAPRYWAGYLLWLVAYSVTDAVGGVGRRGKLTP